LTLVNTNQVEPRTVIVHLLRRGAELHDKGTVARQCRFGVVHRVTSFPGSVSDTFLLPGAGKKRTESNGQETDVNGQDFRETVVGEGRRDYAAPTQPIVFGPFRLDPSTHQLWQGEERVTLQPLAATKGIATSEVEKTYNRARELCWQVGDTRQLLPVFGGL
jgi:hypothetical protein